MGNRQEITVGLEEAWNQLRTGWTGVETEQFYRQYAIKMAEVAEDFEKDCFGLSERAEDLLRKLQLMEFDIDNT